MKEVSMWIVGLLFCGIIVAIGSLIKNSERKQIQKKHDADPSNPIKTNDWYREQESLNENINK